MNKLLLILIPLLVISNAQAALIDDFNGGDMHVAAPNSGSEVYSNAFGGQRSITVSKTGPLGGSSEVASGLLSHNADFLTSTTSLISWTSSTAIDLTDGLVRTAFALDIFSIDQGNIDLTLSITDINSNSSFYTLTNAIVGLQYIDFILFSTVDLQQITDISLEIVGGVSSDMTIDSISTVPTPSVLILLSLGLAALSSNLRKNRA